jgi:glycosyltransferase involved in cell wall biosynthesis
MSVLVSVVVCTYNRADLLPQCLQSLANQKLDKELYEVIIVNNNSSDNTQEIAEALSEKEPNFRVVIETKQGLSNARNRGWMEAHGEYVAYTDDDCLLPPQWLTIARSIIQDRAPGVFGGPYYAFFDSPKPDWFKNDYGSHVIAATPKVLSPQEFLDGGNFFIRKELISELNGFDIKLGMTGNSIAYGEETALQVKIRSQCPEIDLFYHPKLFVYHLVRKEKMSMKWIIYDNFIDGQYSALLSLGSYAPKRIIIQSLLYHIGWCILWIVSTPIALLMRNEEIYPFYQNYLYETGIQILSSLGIVYELMYLQIFRQPSFRKEK